VSLASLLYASRLEIDSSYQPHGPTATAVSAMASAYVPLAGLIDVAAERARLAKQEAEAVRFADGCRRKLENPGFVGKAPAEVVEKERLRLAELEDRLGRLREQLAVLSKE
jgi:valyl-tRNA synthetase